MSLTHRNPIFSLLLAGAALGAVATPAHADVNKELRYTCKWPLVDKQPLKLNLSANIPSTATVDVLQPAWQVDASVALGGDTSKAITTLNAYGLDGDLKLKASVHKPSGAVLDDALNTSPLQPWVRSGPVPDTLSLSTTGQIGPVSLDEVGRTDVVVDEFALNLRAKKADGSPIQVKPLNQDPWGAYVFDSDNDPDTFDVRCLLDAGQSGILGSVCVNPVSTDVTNTCYPAPTYAPSKVNALRSYEIGAEEASLIWAPARDVDGSVAAYNVYRDGEKVASITGTSTKVTGLTPGTSYTLEVEAVDDTGLAGPRVAVSVTTEDQVVTGPLPTPEPGTYGPADAGDDYLRVKWQSIDDPRVAGILIEYAGNDIELPADATEAYVDGLSADTDYTFYISTVDEDGVRGEPLVQTLSTVRTNAAPSKVTGLKAGRLLSTSFPLSWDASVDPDGDEIHYDVYQDLVKIATVTGTSIEVTGLVPGDAKSYTVVAVDSRGAAAPRSDAVKPTIVMEEEPQVLEYALKGSTSLKTLTKGNLPLTGGIKAVPDFAAGTFTADLTLNNTNGRLVAAGFLPITAKVGFVPIGKTTGTLDDATATKPAGITTNSKVRIKVLEVKLFGAIPLAGGNNCQTKQASDITLKSTNAFDPFKGGSIAGTYKISDLNGCGALNGLVSPLTAGGGNTITLDLAYKG